MPNSFQFKTKKEYNEWFRNYRVRRGESLRAYQRDFMRRYRKENKDFREKENEKNFIYTKNNPEKKLARNIVKYSIKTGKLKRGSCVVCGNKKAQAHHPDYNRPLFVKWLCASDHKRLHLGTISI